MPKLIVWHAQGADFVMKKELLFQKYVREVPTVRREQTVNSQHYPVRQVHIQIKKVSGRRVSAVHVPLENIVMVIMVMVLSLHKTAEQDIIVRITQLMINSMMNLATVLVLLDFIVNLVQLIRSHVHLEHTVLKLDSLIEVSENAPTVRKDTFVLSGEWDRQYKLMLQDFPEI